MKSIDENADARARIRRGRLILTLIALVFVIPLLVAAWMQQAARRDGVWGSTNHGALIQPPLEIGNFLLPTFEGPVFMPESLKDKWSLLYFAPSPLECAATCKQMLYYMRQVRLALGRDMGRVQRVLLAAPESLWLEEVAAEYEGMHIVLDIGGTNSIVERLMEAASTTGSTPAGLYLVDPLGNLMMVFPPETDPRDILKDLKKLLRISKVG